MNQTIPASQIIIVDDNSSLPTKIKIKEIGNKFPEIEVIENKVNTGTAFSRNKGFTNCNEDIIIFFDSDDYSHSKRAETHLELHTLGADVAYCSSVQVYSNNYKLINRNDKYIGKIEFNDSIKKIFLGMTSQINYSVPASTMSCTKQAFKITNGFESKLRRLEDMDFFLKCSKQDLIFGFSNSVEISRSSTTATYKSQTKENESFNLLLEIWKSQIDTNLIEQIILWNSIRDKYFNKKIFKLTLGIIRSIKYPVLRNKIIKSGANRFAHDLRKWIK